jgi:hypothetical protein
MTGAMQTFRTKTGHVEVTPATLNIVRTGLRGGAAQTLHGSKAKTWLVYALLCGLCVYIGAREYERGWTIPALLMWGFAAWVVVTLVRARDFSMTPTLVREHTDRIDAVRGIKGLTRDRLVVHFRELGRPARRFIMMPGVLQDGRGELDRAMQMLRESGWPVA